MKSTRLSGSTIDDAISKIGHLSEVCLHDKFMRIETDSLYNLRVCQDIIKEMDMSKSWKLVTNMYYAHMDNEGQ